MIEREGIASGTSFGNASTLADYGCLPIARPEIWRSMPSLLLSPDSPFVIDWKCLPRLSPWLMRFMGQCNATRFRANSEMLAQLLSHTYTDYQPLLDDAPAAAAMIQRKGCLYAYGKAENLQAAQGDIRLRDQLGIHQQVLTADELIALEPAMEGHTAGGVLFPSSCHLDDPQVFIDTLATPLREEGRIVSAEVTRLSRQAPACCWSTPMAGDSWRTEWCWQPGPGRQTWPASSATGFRWIPSVAITSNSISSTRRSTARPARWKAPST